MIAMPLGALLYRAGRFAEAIARLTEAEELPTQRTSPIYGWLFLAMAHHRLGHRAEAQVYLVRLREAMKKAGWRDDREAAGFLREAEALIGAANPGA